MGDPNVIWDNESDVIWDDGVQTPSAELIPGRVNQAGALPKLATRKLFDPTEDSSLLGASGSRTEERNAPIHVEEEHPFIAAGLSAMDSALLGGADEAAALGGMDREDARRELNQLYQENPLSSFIGNVAGMAPYMALTAPASAAGRVGTAAGIGGASGALGGEGAVDRLRGAASGAALGAGTAGLFEVPGAVSRYVKDPRSLTNARLRSVGVNPMAYNNAEDAAFAVEDLSGRGLGPLSTSANRAAVGRGMQNDAANAIVDARNDFSRMMQESRDEISAAVASGEINRNEAAEILASMRSQIAADRASSIDSANALRFTGRELVAGAAAPGGYLSGVARAASGPASRISAAGAASVLESVQSIMANNPSALGRFMRPLMEASSRGGLPAAIWALHSRQDFRQQLEQAQGIGGY